MARRDREQKKTSCFPEVLTLVTMATPDRSDHTDTCSEVGPIRVAAPVLSR